MTVTNQRIVYQGAARTAECPFPKLLGIEHSTGQITISVSNRQKPTTLYFGASIDDWVFNRLTVALALYRGEAATISQQLESQIQELKRQEPLAPTTSA